jgi:hypothetical protein
MVAKTIDRANDQQAQGEWSRVVTRERLLHWTPSVLWLFAAALLLLSTAQPYWKIVLYAPQYPESMYPGGLQMNVYVDRLEGNDATTVNDIAEIDGLNHYIGMKSLGDAAQLERSIAMYVIVLFTALLAVAAFWRRKWAWLLTLPALTFPIAFMVDLTAWMYYFGHSLNPSAALSNAIGSFMPTVLGEGVIAQFRSVAHLQTGWYFAAGGTLLSILALVIVYLDHRQSRKAARSSAGETTGG